MHRCHDPVTSAGDQSACDPSTWSFFTTTCLHPVPASRVCLLVTMIGLAFENSTAEAEGDWSSLIMLISSDASSDADFDEAVGWQPLFWEYQHVSLLLRKLQDYEACLIVVQTCRVTFNQLSIIESGQKCLRWNSTNWP